MDYEDRLRLLAVGLSDGTASRVWPRHPDPASLDARSIALARLAALVAVGGPVPSFDAATDAAVSAGATPDDCVDVLEAILDIVGAPRVVQAAPALALALGHDLDDSL